MVFVVVIGEVGRYQSGHWLINKFFSFLLTFCQILGG